ncbi:uncharacterized protein A1O9_06889 [Exophiala aquamarina CBS 119918]|uniref:Transcription factor domain-containing protein n=1 Tax=Exophiala aquamarina CBS 119918 TaxID=1182545 RepID=A0A072PMF6_9EURO|nr:uncharacterized protein A1O9_06889 [Exophiala aquamarina CBS 119918]KEF56700.1 hypothetical protein A1O9_06889 [Exophiala aquamarina CBS 119918]
MSNSHGYEELATLDEQACTRFLKRYQEISEAAPFAFRLRSINVSQLLDESPLLLLSIIVTASSSNHKVQRQADRAFLHAFADRVIFNGEKRMEIFQSLLTYLNWYHQRFDSQKQQFYQFMQLANGMAADLFLPRLFACDTAALVKTPQITDRARVFLQCYYLNVGGNALGFDRPETMQCPQSLLGAAHVLATAREFPFDEDAPVILELMVIASQHQKWMRSSKDDARCFGGLQNLRDSLCGWRAKGMSSSTQDMLAPTYHFVTAYTFLKSKALRQPGSLAIEIGLEACQAVLTQILAQGSSHLVELCIVEWAHLITTLFILPWLEISATLIQSTRSVSAHTPSTIGFISAFRAQLLDLKIQSEQEKILQAETLVGWLETILTAVETRATALSGKFSNSANEEETAFELVNSFLNKEIGGLSQPPEAVDQVGSCNSKEDSWLDFMSDWLDW